MLKIKLLIICIIQFFSLTSFSEVIGYIDQVENIGGQIRIRGWACQRGLNESVKVDFYTTNGANGDPVRNGVKQGEFEANFKSEDAVSNSSNCNTKFNKHRFRYILTYDQWKRSQNKTVYLRAFSRNESAIIYRSGNFTIG